MFRPTQSNDYSCGPACLAFVSALAGRPFSELDILASVDARPRQGTDNLALVAWCRENLPEYTRAAGEDLYEGGLAIANISNPLTGCGHFVVLLGRQDGVLKVWCPAMGSCSIAEERLVWRSGCGGYRNWAINFSGLPIPDQVGYVPKVVILTGTEDCVAGDHGAMLHLIRQLKLRGVPVQLSALDGVSLRGANLWVDGLPVHPEDAVFLHLQRHEVHHTDLLRLLSRSTARFVNNPAGLLAWHGKLHTLGARATLMLTAASRQEAVRAATRLMWLGATRIRVRQPASTASRVLARPDEAVEAFDWASMGCGYAILEDADEAKFIWKAFVSFGVVQVLYDNHTRLGQDELSADCQQALENGLVTLWQQQLRAATLVFEGADLVDVRACELSAPWLHPDTNTALYADMADCLVREFELRPCFKPPLVT